MTRLFRGIAGPAFRSRWSRVVRARALGASSPLMWSVSVPVASRSRIFPWLCEMALAQIWPTLRSTRLSVDSTLASIEVPIPTTAMGNCPAPSWVRACRLVASASTSWVSRPDHSCTSWGFRSTASTSWPRRCSAAAAEAPNRPRPTTITASEWSFPLPTARKVRGNRQHQRSTGPPRASRSSVRGASSAVCPATMAEARRRTWGCVACSAAAAISTPPRWWSVISCR